MGAGSVVNISAWSDALSEWVPLFSGAADDSRATGEFSPMLSAVSFSSSRFQLGVEWTSSRWIEIDWIQIFYYDRPCPLDVLDPRLCLYPSTAVASTTYSGFPADNVLGPPDTLKWSPDKAGRVDADFFDWLEFNTSQPVFVGGIAVMVSPPLP